MKTGTCNDNLTQCRKKERKRMIERKYPVSRREQHYIDLTAAQSMSKCYFRQQVALSRALKITFKYSHLFLKTTYNPEKL